MDKQQAFNEMVTQAVVDRLNELIAQQGTTPKALCSNAGIPPCILLDILSYKNQDPDTGTLAEICHGFTNPEISLRQFFDAEIFRALSQKLKQLDFGGLSRNS